MTTSLAPVSNQVIGDLAYDLVAQVAPEEELIFEENRDAYFANPAQALAAEQSKEDMLGFGTEVVVFVTPFVLAIIAEAAKFLAEELKKALGAEVGETVKLLFKKYRPAAGRQAPPPLTLEQLAQVRELAYQKARQFKLPPDKANQIAEALVGSLVKVP